MSRKLLSLILLLVAILYSHQLLAQEESIKVMSFNIRYNNPDDGPNAWPLRKEQVVSVIRFHDVDLLGLQEAQTDQLEFLERELPEYGWCGQGRLAGGDGEEFCSIFYKKDKFELRKTITFWLSETPEVKVSKSWDSSLPRICTLALLKKKSDGRNFVFFNTHFDHRGIIAREESARLIINRMKEYGDYPLILSGDFNCGKTSKPITLLKQSLSETSSASKTPSYGPRWTFHGFRGLAGAAEIIDYIFVNSGFSVVRHGNLVDNIDGKFPSDHLPVLAELLISE